MSCPTPFLRKINGYLVPVPCGRCIRCRIDDRNKWTWRICAELQSCDGVFVSLTINDDYLRGPSVYVKSIQDYHKRLRKNLKGRKIKYFTVSEYGDEAGGHRPHYHEILMNVSAGKPLTADLGDIPVIQKSWPFGFIKVEPACKSNIRYVLKYLDKMLSVDDFKIKYPDLLPPFRLVSNGVGAEWIRTHGKDLLNDKGQFYFDGAWRPLPRYYKEKLGLIDKYREDYSDVSLWSRISSNPKKWLKIVDNLPDNVISFYDKVAIANENLGRQELIDLQRKMDNGYHL